MSRTKEITQTPAAMPEILPAKATELMAAQDAAPSKEQMDAVLAAGIDLGRIEALDFVITVSNSAILPIYENVKKSKAWQFLRNPESAHGNHFESFDEFCQIKLGKSYARLRALAANRNLIGHEAFDQAEKMGLRQVDYNAIKALPAPDQELIRQAVGTQSRDEVLDLLQELAGRHSQVTAALTKDLQEAEQALGDEKRISGKKSERIQAQQDQIDRIAVLPADEDLADLQAKASKRMNSTLASIKGELRQALIAVRDHHSDQENSLFMAGLVGQVQADLNALREEFNLPDISNARDQELAAEVAQWATPAKA